MTFEHNAIYLASINNEIRIVRYQLDLSNYSESSNTSGFGYISETLDRCTHCTFNNNKPPDFVQVLGKLSDGYATLSLEELQTIYPEYFV